MSADYTENLIMVVDDEEEIRLSLCDFLELEGYETVCACDGSKALLALEISTPQIIISDLMMPEVSGLALLDEMAQRNIHIPVIIMTAYASVDRAIQAMKNGAADFVTKPLDLDYLLQVVERVKERIQMGEKIKIHQQQLIQSEKMASLGRLVAGIAHEINNPVNFIYSNIDPLKHYLLGYKRLASHIRENKSTLPLSLQQELDAVYQEEELNFADQDSEKLIHSFEDGSQRIARIVADLRQYSRVDKDSYCPVNLHELIDSTLNLLVIQYKKHVTVHKEYGSLPPVLCSPGQMGQVFMNLLSNAEQAIEGEGNVWIRTGMENGRVQVEIKDDGKGIAPEILTKIFDPFFTTKPVGSGTGLGLSISMGIVQQHGGEIVAASQPGQGATFTVILPMHSENELKNGLR